MPHFTDITQEQALWSFRLAKRFASTKNARLAAEATAFRMQQPLREAEHLGKVDDTVTLYGRLRASTDSAVDIWGKLGLAEEFKRRFTSDDLFWESPLSFIEVYRILRQDQASRKEQTQVRLKFLPRSS